MKNSFLSNQQILHLLIGNIIHDLRNLVARSKARESAAQKTLLQLIGGYEMAFQNQLLAGQNDINDEELNSLMEKGQGFKQDVQRVEEQIASDLHALERIFLNDPNVEKETLELCSMAECIQTLEEHIFPPTDDQEIIHWDGEDFSFMGNKIIILRVLVDILNCILDSNNQNSKVFIHQQKESEKNCLIIKGTTSSNWNPGELSYAEHVMTQLEGQLAYHKQENGDVEVRLLLPEIQEKNGSS